jgi:Na+-driven multidrug efflux pump
MSLLATSALYFPVWIVTATMFFILRSGGKTKQLFIMDATTIWLLVIPTASILLNLNVEFVYNVFFVYAWDLFKLLIALAFILQYKWVNVLTNKKHIMGEDSDPTAH